MEKSLSKMLRQCEFFFVDNVLRRKKNCKCKKVYDEILSFQ